MKHPIILIALVTALLCPLNSNPANPKFGFAIYKLRDSTITGHQAYKLSVNDPELEPVPLLTDNDIKTYQWSTHSFVLNPRSDSLLQAMATWPYKSEGVPFVVTVSAQRVYVGSFWWWYSSSIPEGVHINLPPFGPYRLNFLPEHATQPDKRSDQRIYDALQAAGVLVER